MPLQKKTPSISGFYRVGLGATVVAILVIMLMNLATPFEFILTQIDQVIHNEYYSWVQIMAFRFVGICILGIIATTPFLMVMRHVLTPISQCLDLKTRQRPIPHSLETKAKQRLINLPFIMAPVIISL